MQLPLTDGGRTGETKYFAPSEVILVEDINGKVTAPKT